MASRSITANWFLNLCNTSRSATKAVQSNSLKDTGQVVWKLQGKTLDTQTCAVKPRKQRWWFSSHSIQLYMNLSKIPHNTWHCSVQYFFYILYSLHEFITEKKCFISHVYRTVWKQAKTGSKWISQNALCPTVIHSCSGPVQVLSLILSKHCTLSSSLMGKLDRVSDPSDENTEPCWTSVPLTADGNVPSQWKSRQRSRSFPMQT